MPKVIASLTALVLTSSILSSPAGAQHEVLHLHLDEGSGSAALDASGLGNHGTVVGPSYTTTGLTTHYPTGSALDFFGGPAPADHVLVPDSPSLRPDSVTVEGWVRQTSAAGINVILGKQVGNGPDSWVLYTNGGALVWSIYNGSQPSVATPFDADSAWHHVAGTFGVGGRLNLYLDGCLVASNQVGGAIQYDANPVTIGADQNAASIIEGWMGSIDEIRVHSEALDPMQIATLAFHPLVETYCTAGVTASGCTALLAATGTASATAPSGFSLLISSAEGSKDGTFYFGMNGRQANPWGNGTSFQCVTPPVVRTGLQVGVGSNGACDGAFVRDLNALWCPACPAPQKNPGPGACVQAQFWHRDPMNTSNQTTSLSGAIEFLVGP